MDLKFKDIHQAMNYLLQNNKVQVEEEKRERIGYKSSLIV